MPIIKLNTMLRCTTTTASGVYPRSPVVVTQSEWHKHTSELNVMNFSVAFTRYFSINTMHIMSSIKNINITENIRFIFRNLFLISDHHKKKKRTWVGDIIFYIPHATKHTWNAEKILNYKFENFCCLNNDISLYFWNIYMYNH